MIIITGIIIFLSMLLLNFWVYYQNKPLIKELKDLPASTYALVLGAGLESDGKPTDILSDRVYSAVKIFNTGIVSKLIMSGSSKRQGYDEVAAMKTLALQAGVDQINIIGDNAGVSTFDSLINFRNRFQNEKLVIVTQYFHLQRALWLAAQLGLDCYGFSANRYRFSLNKKLFWTAREFISFPYNLIKLIIFQIQRNNRPI